MHRCVEDTCWRVRSPAGASGPRASVWWLYGDTEVIDRNRGGLGAWWGASRARLMEVYKSGLKKIRLISEPLLIHLMAGKGEWGNGRE